MFFLSFFLINILTLTLSSDDFILSLLRNLSVVDFQMTVSQLCPVSRTLKLKLRFGRCSRKPYQRSLHSEVSLFISCRALCVVPPEVSKSVKS